MMTEPTAKQRARVPEISEKWTRIALCTDPADRAKAEEGVRLAYRIAGLKPPRKIVWCDSPLSLPGDPGVLANDRDSVWASIKNSTKTSMQHSIQHADYLFVYSVILSRRTPVWDLVLNSDKFVAFRTSVRDSLFGQHDASLLAYYDYLRITWGPSQETEKILGLMQVAENANWWLPRKDICWICERPSRLIRDDRGRLHCEDGPALSYPDGWSIYAIHGILVDEQTIMRPRSQNVDVIRKERNAEVKRIRIERFGWPEYLRAVGATVMDIRDNDVEATKEALMKTPDGQVVLVCACPSTSRVYCLEVRPGIVTCEAAQDWLSGGLSHRVINGA